MRSNAQDALELAELGWWLLPLHTWNVDKCDCMKQCTSPAKHPRTMHGLKDASCDLAQVVEWWGQWPAANIGVRTGPESCIVVVDIDPRNGGMESWESLREHHAYEHDGPACLTGGGGMHLYFAHPGEKVMSRSGELAEGVDVKGDGGYVVAPPSVHARGTSYAWIEGYAPWERPPGQIPFWLLELMHKPVEGISGAQPIADKITQGKRRSVLLSLAGSMRHRNMGETAIFNALMAENAEKCEPPLDMREIAKLAADAATWEPGSATILPSTKPGPTSSERRKASFDPVTFTAVELDSWTLPEVQWAVKGLLPEGLGILAGKPKMGKSWMAFHIGIAIAVGGVAMGTTSVASGDVLYLALEDNDRRLQKRLKMLMAGDDPPERMHFSLKWPKDAEGGVTVLESFLGAHPETKLIIIDTLAKFRGNAGKDSGYAEDYASMDGLQRLAADAHVCILLVHHMRKQFADDWVDTISGTLGIAGSADTLMGLEGKRGEKDAVLHRTGRDLDDDSDLALQRDPVTGIWTITGDAAAYRLGKETELLIDMLQDLGHPATPSEVAPLIEKTRAATKMLLRRAARAGHIQAVGNGLYAAYPTDEDEGGQTVLPALPVTREHGNTGNTGNIEMPTQIQNRGGRSIKIVARGPYPEEIDRM